MGMAWFARICVNFNKKIYAIYKPSNKFFNDLILRIRSKFGGRIVKKKS